MLRKLDIGDKEYMLEWMHQPDISMYFQEDFNSFDINRAEMFIRESFDNTNKHFAITNDNNEYQGTISLKNIDYVNLNAEYAIVLRECAMHTGCSKNATLEILEYGFSELGLNKVYLNVLGNNIRAIKFYEKIGFIKEGVFRKHLKIRDKLIDLHWYSLLREEYSTR